MASTKKNGNNSSALPNTVPNRVARNWGDYLQETQKLEADYTLLRSQFYDLREKWEASHQTLEQLILYMSDGLMFVTQEGIISLYNPSAAEMLGCPGANVLHKPYDTCFSDDLFGFSMREALLKTGGHQRIFLSLGAGTELEVSTSRVPNKGILLLLSNRTEQQKLQKSINQAEKLQELGEMAATLAHEIRNPLGGIEGFARLLKRDLQGEAHQRMIDAILHGTGALNRLVTQVLDYAKPMRLHFSPTDLFAMVQESCALVSAEDHVCQFQLHFPCAAYVISADRERLQQVVLNVLRNASEAGATTVDIFLMEKGALIFRDNGPGIKPEDLNKIFTPFFTTKARGTGLGLAASLAVIKAHGGTLEVASEEGKGTQFTLTLPG